MTQAGSANDLALEALCFDWESAYDIGYDAARRYWARRRDGLGGDLTGEDAEALRSRIRADYIMKPLPRDPAIPVET